MVTNKYQNKNKLKRLNQKFIEKSLIKKRSMEKNLKVKLSSINIRQNLIVIDAIFVKRKVQYSY